MSTHPSVLLLSDPMTHKDAPGPPRVVLHDVLSKAECEELIFVSRCLGAGWCWADARMLSVQRLVDRRTKSFHATAYTAECLRLVACLSAAASTASPPLRRSLCVLGYRPGVCSATLHDIGRSVAAQLLVPVVGAQRLGRREEALGD